MVRPGTQGEGCGECSQVHGYTIRAQWGCAEEGDAVLGPTRRRVIEQLRAADFGAGLVSSQLRPSLGPYRNEEAARVNGSTGITPSNEAGRALRHVSYRHEDAASVDGYTGITPSNESERAHKLGSCRQEEAASVNGRTGSTTPSDESGGALERERSEWHGPTRSTGTWFDVKGRALTLNVKLENNCGICEFKLLMSTPGDICRICELKLLMSTPGDICRVCEFKLLMSTPGDISTGGHAHHPAV